MTETTTPGPGQPIEVSQIEGRVHDQSGHSDQDAPPTVNRATDDAIGYTSHPQNFDITHSADPAPPITVKIPD